MTSLLIRGGTVVNADRAFRADVLCQDGRIVAVGENLQAAGVTVVDAGGHGHEGHRAEEKDDLMLT